MEIKYKCNCGWIGAESEMGADYYFTEYDEIWSNWICPSCKEWHSLDDYDIMSNIENLHNEKLNSSDNPDTNH